MRAALASRSPGVGDNPGVASRLLLLCPAPSVSSFVSECAGEKRGDGHGGNRDRPWTLSSVWAAAPRRRVRVVRRASYSASSSVSVSAGGSWEKGGGGGGGRRK